MAQPGSWKIALAGVALGVATYGGASLIPHLAGITGPAFLVHLSALTGIVVALASAGFFWNRDMRNAVQRAQGEGSARLAQAEETIGLLSKHGRDLEHALTERNHRINEVFEGMPGEVLWVSRDLRYVRVNSQLALAEGLYPRDFEGRPVGFTGRDVSKRIRLALQDFFQGNGASLQTVVGEASEARMVSMRKFRNGEDALVLAQAMGPATHLRGHEAPGGVGAPGALPQTPSTGLGSARLASLGEMVAGIAHEINNSLAIINGRVQILRTKAVSGQLSSEELLLALDKLSQTVFRVSKIITGLRSFVRPGTGETPEDLLPVRAIEDALDFCKGRFHKQNTRIVLEVTSTRLVRCVPVQLSQILLNLLNNSLHALDGSAERWVRIEAHDVDGEMVEFKVVDSGQGVAADISERIFEPFFTTKDFSKGTGLGLSISRGLAESNGGALFIDKHASHTTFVLRLPAVADSTGQAQGVASEVEPEDLPS
jgi:C4-dicarboxylate-specific signal transduction histidine kinase